MRVLIACESSGTERDAFGGQDVTRHGVMAEGKETCPGGSTCSTGPSSSAENIAAAMANQWGGLL